MKKPASEMIEALFLAAESLLLKNTFGKINIEGIGISYDGPLSNKRGVISSPHNLPGWDNNLIVELCNSQFRNQTLLKDDAGASRMEYSIGKGYQNIIFLTFGKGMGAGLILDGKLYSGTADLAGEVGIYAYRI